MLDQLIALMVKISKYKRPVHIEVSYDGKHWHWKFKSFDTTADEWQPRPNDGGQAKKDSDPSHLT